MIIINLFFYRGSSSSSDSLNKFRLSITKQTNASNSTANNTNLSNVGNLNINGISGKFFLKFSLFQKLNLD